MKLHKLLIVPTLVSGFVPLLTVTSCANKRYDISKYVTNIPFKPTEDSKDFDVLQLTDTHWFGFDSQEQWEQKFQLIQKTYGEAKNQASDQTIDFIVITGDLVNEATKENWLKYCEMFDSLQTPWTVTFGNHDARGYLSMQDVTSILNEYSLRDNSYLIFHNDNNDNLTGDCNYAINLVDKNTTKWQLITIDSGRYESQEYVGYDYIHPDQIDWYRQLVQYTKQQNNHIVPSLAFFHVPLVEYLSAAQAVNRGELHYEEEDDVCGETVCCPRINTGLFDVMKELGSTKGCFVGHDHVNDFSVIYDGIMLAYGVKSSHDIYHRDDMLGGRLISLKDNNTFTSKKIIVTDTHPDQDFSSIKEER